MTHIQRSTQVPYGAAEMYQLVTDVAAYPEFLPWCENVEVLQSSDSEVLARVTLAASKLRQSFTTRNRMQPQDWVVMELVEGPFKHLTGEWQFEPLPSGCRVSLDMSFEFKNRLVRMTLGGTFNRLVNSLMDAFIERAHSVYGYRQHG